MLLGSARDTAALLEPLLLAAGARRVMLVGEARRGHEIVDDVEILCAGGEPGRLERAMRSADEVLLVARIKRQGDELSIDLQGRGEVRVVVVPEEEFLFELLVRTGPPVHIAALQARATPHGGLAAAARRSTDERALYTLLELGWIPPELRDHGKDDPVSDVVDEDSIAGIFHVHTRWSDGNASLEEMVRAAATRGFEFVGISEHSQAAIGARGLDAAALRRQADEVALRRVRCTHVEIFHGVEVDILEDGSLDLADDVLASLDFVIASVHTHLKLTADAMTNRLVRAVSHPLVTMLGHPTGRLLLARNAALFDMTTVARAAVDHEVYLEINANPQRLDLSAANVRVAAACGANFVINPDAHSPEAFRDTALGLVQARRAGLAAGRILNTRTPPDVAGILAARKRKALGQLAHFSPFFAPAP